MDVIIEQPGGVHRTVRLGARVGTAGSQGEVREITGNATQVAKVLRESHRSRLIERLTVLGEPPWRRGTGAPHPVPAAWPIDRVRRIDDGALIGFTMPYLRPPTHHLLVGLLDDNERNVRLPAAGWFWLAAAATNLARMVARLNQLGVVVGDLAPPNLFVTGGAKLTVVDVDGWQIRPPRGGEPLPCPFSRSEYTAPELLDQPAGTVRRASSDRWALAVVTAQILLMGTHPFAGVPAGGSPPYDEVSNVLARRCWLLGHQVIVPDGVPDITKLLPDDVRRLFDRCFDRGADRPDERPTPAMWATALVNVERDLVSCARNTRHVHLRTARHCPWCLLAAEGHDRFPAVRAASHAAPRNARSQEAAR
jgi:DNA-binding helix-hairpin-helix protein with protein kinase domain